ncbi:MAG: pyridoxamine 5'-phosphate oxidase family protein [Clostridiales bacterium]|nr:pyridoxamine 5'-phosphate oxidase family protein [Clostridiales bacterium]
MKEVLEYLKEAEVFYFATSDGDQPTVRPFGFCIEFEGKLYFGTRETGNTYRHLSENPKFQVCAVVANKGWIRITGKAQFDSSPEVLATAIAEYPDLLGGNTFTPALFFVEDGKAEFYTMLNVSRVVKF